MVIVPRAVPLCSCSRRLRAPADDGNGLGFGVMRVGVRVHTCDDGLREPSCSGAVETKGLAAAQGGSEEET